MEAFSIQAQMRQNATEMQDYLRDLNNWEKSVKNKDRTISKTGSTSSFKKHTEDTDHSITSNQPARVKTFETVNQIKCESIATTPVRTVHENIDVIERERGNSYFKSGEFEKALRCYTRSIGINSKNPVTFSNRAMLYIKQRKYRLAEQDCTHALLLNSTTCDATINVKALQRRATARKFLGNIRASLSDLIHASKINPNSLEISREISSTKENLIRTMRNCPKQRITIVLAPQPIFKPEIHSETIKNCPEFAEKSIKAICINDNFIREDVRCGFLHTLD